MALRKTSAQRVRANTSRRTKLSTLRKMFLESLEPRQLMAVVTGGTGPGGFERIDGNSELEIWLDAKDVNANGTATSDGALVTNWQDKSGNDRDFDGIVGDPNFVASSTNGYPTVNFDGNDVLNLKASENPRNFIDGNGAFTLISVARYAGSGHNRVIAARSGHNWLFGFHGGSVNRFHYDAWGSLDVGGQLNDENWHLHMNLMNVFNDANDPAGDFYRDGILLSDNSRGTADSFNNNVPDGLTVGGWGGGEVSTAEVSELLMYNRVLNEAEHRIVQNYLNAKYDVTPTLELYAGDTGSNGNYDLDVFGVGRHDASNQLLSAGQSGFGIEVAGLTDDGDYILAGHKTPVNGKSAIGTVPQITDRWNRSWFVDVTDPNDNVSATFAFDYSDAGLTKTNEQTFKLLRASSDGGTFTAVPGAVATVNGDTITFSVSAAEVQDGYYTLGDSSLAPQVTTSPGDTNYTTNAPAVPIDPALTITDLDSANLVGATVSIGGFVGGNTDVLTFSNQNGITGSYASGVLTLSGTSSLTNYQTALRTVGYSNPNFVAPRTITFTVNDGTFTGSAGKRVVSIATATADSDLWEGDVDSNWNTPGNWSLNRVPDANDFAIFGDSATGTSVATTGAPLVGQVRLLGVAKGFTFSGDSIFTSTISQTGTATNVINGTIKPDLTFTGTVSAGRLELRNTANSTTLSLGTWIVNSGGTLAAVANNSVTGLGAANVQLNGGNLEFLPGAAGIVGGLRELWFDGNFGDANIDPIDSGSGFLTMTPGATSILNTALAFDGNAMNARSGGLVGTDGIGAAWTGIMNVGPGLPIVAGDVSFATNSDDGTSFWIDLDRNNVFSHSGANGDEMVVSNLGSHGNTQRFGTRTLTAGPYKIAMGFYEGNGGELAEARFAQGNTTNFNAMSVINPADAAQAGLWTIVSTPPGTLANNVSVTANSNIILASTLPGVQLNKLTMSPGTTLTVNSADTKQDLEFASVTLGGAATIAGVGTPDITLRNIGESVGSSLTYNGNTTIFLPTANTYTGQTTINNNATVVASISGALGTAASGTTVNSGGALVLSGNFGYAATEQLTLNGTGNAAKDAALSIEGGTVSFAGQIIAGSGTKIRTTAGNFQIFGQINVNGQGLELRADRQIEVQNGGITGGGSITKTGGDRVAMFANADGGTNFSANLFVNEGVWDARGDNSLGSASGTTTVNNGARLEIRDGKTLSDNITINGNSGGAGAIRSENGNNTLTGNVTLASASMIFVNQNQLTINGQVNGNNALTKSGPGLLILKQDSFVSNVDLAGGEVRISTQNGLGSTSTISVDGGEALGFDGSFNFNGGTPLQSISVNGGTLRAASGTTTIDIPLIVGLVSDVNFDGAGNINVLRGFGNGNTPISTGFINHYGFRRFFAGGDGQNMMDLNNNNANSMMSGGNPATHPNLTGQALLTNGPGDRGLDFNDDGDFMAAVNVPADEYTNLWIGKLHVTTPGDWKFRLAELDDWGGIWLDRNQDGTFQSSAAGLGSDRNEQLAWNDGGTKTVNLGVGDYTIAFTHLEGGGGSSIRFFYQAPGGPELTVKPSDPAQAGLWIPYAPVNPLTNVNKSGTGVVTLAGNNTFSGAVNVRAGTLVAANNNAFGLAGGNVALSGNASVGFQGNVTITGENITGGDGKGGGQLGTIVNVSGNNTFLGNVTASTAPSAGQELSLASAAGTLTIGAPGGGQTLDAKASKLAFDGPGNVIVNSNVINQTSTLFGNGLRHYGFRRDPGDALFDLRNNGGMLNNGSPTTHPTFTGQAILTDGPSGTGLDFNVESEFINAVNVPSDNYANLFVGLLHVTAATVGTWEFRESDRDDWSGIWVDVNGNGNFDTPSAGLITNHGEQLGYNDQGTKSVTFNTPGDYLIAFTHLEGGGDSRIEFRVKSPTMAAQAIIKPTDPVQAGYFQIAFAPQNEVIKRGTGTATLTGNNTYNGVTNVNAGMLIAANNNALGSAGQGTNVASGGTLGLQNNVTIASEGVTIDGNGALVDTDGNGSPDTAIGALISTSGNNTLSGPITVKDVSLGQVGLGALSGATLNVTSNLDLRFSRLNVGGAGNVNLSGIVSGVGATQTFSENALPLTGFAGADNQLYHFGFHINNDAVAFNIHNNAGVYNNGNPTTFSNFEGAGLLTDGPGGRGLDFNGDADFRAVLASLQDDASGDGRVIDQDDNYTNLLTGFLNVSAADAGNWNFRINDHDDPAAIWIDLDRDGVFEAANGSLQDANGELIAYNGGCCAQRDLKTIPLTEGSYRVAFVQREGGGGSTLDITFAKPGLSERSIKPTDPAQAGLWSTRVFKQTFADNSLVKSGTGTLTLSNANTYNGGTTVNSGTLLANNPGGSATGPSAVTVNGPATLGGTGAVSGLVTLQSGAFLAPGVSGAADIGTGGLTLSNGSTFTVNINGPAADTQYDQIDVTGTVNLNGATLSAVLAGTATFPTNGQTFVIIDNDGSDPVVGTFAQGSTLVTSNAVFTINYNGGTGNDVVLTAVIPTIAFSSATYQDSEGAGTSNVITLTRTGELGAQSQVQVSITGGTATGADYNAAAFPMTVTFAPGSNTATVPLSIVDDAFSDINETITFAVASVSNGSVGGQSSTTFTIIDNDNRAPTAVNDTANMVTVTEDAAKNIAGTVGTANSGVLGNDSDPDNDPLTVSAFSPTGITKGILTLNSGVLTYNPNGAFESLQNGQTDTTQSFTYTIDDGKGGTSSATAIITVTGVNDAPVLGAPAQSAIVGQEGNTLTNTGTFNDVDSGDNVTFTATVGGVPRGTITKTGTNNGSWSWSLPVNEQTSGPVQVVVTATDSQGATRQTQFTYQVNNTAPTLTISSTTNPIAEGSTFTLNLSATDPGTDTISSWQINWGDGSALQNVPGNPSSVTHVYDNGPANVTVSATATDEDGTYSSNTLAVTVNNAAPLPSQTGILVNNQPATPSGGTLAIVPGMAVTFQVKATDPAKDSVDAPFTFVVNFGDGTPTVTGTATAENQVVSFTHVYSQTGTFQPTVTATDRPQGGAELTSAPVNLTRISSGPQAVIGGVLYVGGTDGADRITVQTSSSGGIAIRMNNVMLPPQSVRNLVVVYGNNGSDTITVGGTLNIAMQFYGGEGDDYLAGGNGKDLLDGGIGRDRLLGGAGDDTILGGDANDTISGGGGNDYLSGDEYVDILGGTVRPGFPPSQPGDILMGAAPGNDNLNGDAGHDHLFGGGGNDVLTGGLGNDDLHGNDGVDRVDGGDGADLLMGDAGGDTLYGRGGRDVMIGGLGIDTLYGGTSADLLFAGDTSLDEDSLKTVWMLWSSGQSLEAAETLEAGVVDDEVGDSVHGEGDGDWYLIFAGDLFRLASEKKAPNVVRPQ
jgi:fibronectin-binding autotransporter adhesin